MIKYYKELEKPNDFTLPLIETKFDSQNYKYIEIDKLPLEFFDKYEYLLRAMKDIHFLMMTIDLEQISNRLRAKWGQTDWEYTRKNWELWHADYGTLSELTEIKEEMSGLKIKLETTTDIISTIQFYDTVMSKIIYLCPDIADEWKKIYLLLVTAVKDITTYTHIKYGKDAHHTCDARDVKLPNAWYITSYGDLYNTGGPKGHKETNLIYSYQEIKHMLLENKSMVGIANAKLQEKFQINNNGYIDSSDFQSYLNYKFDFSFVPTSARSRYFDRKSYNSRIVKTILGVISVQASFYRFFESMQEYTSNPNHELYKLKDMTDDQIGDILVRCAGCYKIETSLNKTITTSSLTPFQDLYEYIIRGWDVCIIPPIIVSREEGIVKELDINSPIVETYIEKGTQKYKQHQQVGYGKIYIKDYNEIKHV